jgi:hypothetical protein
MHRFLSGKKDFVVEALSDADLSGFTEIQCDSKICSKGHLGLLAGANVILAVFLDRRISLMPWGSIVCAA